MTKNKKSTPITVRLSNDDYKGVLFVVEKYEKLNKTKITKSEVIKKAIHNYVRNYQNK